MADTARDNLLDFLTAAIGDWAQSARTSQATLPNGLASLNPANVNAYINTKQLNRQGPFAGLLRQVAATANKATKLKVLEGLTDAVGREQGEFNLLLGNASTRPQSLSAYLNLIKALADVGGFSQTSAVLQIGTSGANLLVAYATLLWGPGALKQLNQMTVANAQALVNYDATMRKHLAALKAAKGLLDECLAGRGPYTITYSQSSYPSISVLFEAANPRDFVDGWVKRPDGGVQGMSLHTTHDAVTRGGKKVPDLFRTGAHLSAGVGPGAWTVNVCPTKPTARFACGSMGGPTVCGCGLNLTVSQSPLNAPDYSVPLVLKSGQSAIIIIREP